MLDHSEAPALQVPDPWFLGGVINSSLSSASPYLIFYCLLDSSKAQVTCLQTPRRRSSHNPQAVPAQASQEAPVEPWLCSWSFAGLLHSQHGGFLVSVLAQLSQHSQEPKQTQSSTFPEQHSSSASQGFAVPSPEGLCHASPAQGTGDPGWVHSSNGTPCEQHSSHGSQPNITQQHAEPPEKPHQQVKDKPLAFSGLKLSH